jgi:uncharacterized repeat protein (TIGR01451 family)
MSGGSRSWRSTGRVVGRRLPSLIGFSALMLAIGALVPSTALAPADLSITKSDSPDPVNEGGQLTYTIEVRNGGPDAAANVVVTDDLPSSDFDLISVIPSQGSCDTQGGQNVSCNLGTLASGSAATVTIQVTAKKPGTVSNTASVTSSEADPQGANNTVTETTTVLEAPKPPGGKPPKGTCKTATPTITGTEASDTLVGTQGNDVIFALGGDDGVTGLGGKDLICGGSGNDLLKGQADGDVVRGGGDNDVTKGGGANDKVGGGAGNDRLGGGLGADFLNGGPGGDRCNGGPGKDTFRSC